MTDADGEHLTHGIELFNGGLFWEAHEVWEKAWMPDRRGPEAAFYKGLIQVAAGSLHYTRRNRKGALMKWSSGADLLRPYLPVHRGVDLEGLVEYVDRCRDSLASAQSCPEVPLPKISLTA